MEARADTNTGLPLDYAKYEHNWNIEVVRKVFRVKKLRAQPLELPPKRQWDQLSNMSGKPWLARYANFTHVD